MTEMNVARDSKGDLLTDLAKLVEQPRHNPGPRCGVTLLLNQLRDVRPDVADLLTVLVDNERISSRKIAGVMSEHGFEIQDQPIVRHRKRGKPGGCKCPREATAA